MTVFVDVRNIPVADPAGLIAGAKEQGKVAIVIRNQPHGSVAVDDVIPLQRQLAAVFADGKVVTAPDPNQKQLGNLDARFVLKGEGRKGAGGVVFGNQTLKIGAPIELEGREFRLNGSVSGLQLSPS